MKIISGDLWDFWKVGEFVAVTTNGSLRTNGEAVMGKGVALQAKIRLPSLPAQLGKRIKTVGNCVHVFDLWHICSFPTKHQWFEDSDIKLIEKSCIQLRDALDVFKNYNITELGIGPFEEIKRVFLPPPGCGNGNLKWNDVSPVLQKHLDERFILVMQP